MAEPRVDASGNARVTDTADLRYTTTGGHFSTEMLELLDASVGAGVRDGDNELVWVLKATPYNLVTNTTEDVYFASTTFRTSSTDTPANTPMLGRLVPPNLRVSLVSGGTIANGITQTRGAIKLINHGDEGFDRNGVLVSGRGQFDSYRTMYSWDNRQAVMYVGPKDGTFVDDFEVYDTFSIAGLDWNYDEVILSPGPALTDWNKVVQSNTYGQRYVVKDGDSVILADGSIATVDTIFDDLSNVPKPLALGHVYGIQPQVTSQRSGIYQFHAKERLSDPSPESLDTVYEDGLAMTPVPDGTDYTADLTDGTFDLLTETSATITADIKGARIGPSDSYVDRPGAIIQGSLYDYMGLEPSQVRTEDLAKLDLAYDHEAGYYFGSNHVVRKAFLDEMLRPIAFWFIARGGRFAVGWLKNPSEETPTLTLAAKDILSVKRRSTVPPAWRVRVGYAPIGKPIDYGDFAGAVTETEMARQSQAYRYVEATDEGVLDRFIAEDLTFETRIASESGAQDLAEALLTLYRKPRDIIEVDLTNKFLRYDIGDVIRVGWPRYDFIDDGLLLQENGDQLILEESGALTLVTDGGDTLITDGGDSLVTDGAAGANNFLAKEEHEEGSNFLVVGYVDNPASNDFKVTLWG